MQLLVSNDVDRLIDTLEGIETLESLQIVIVLNIEAKSDLKKRAEIDLLELAVVPDNQVTNTNQVVHLDGNKVGIPVDGDAKIGIG